MSKGLQFNLFGPVFIEVEAIIGTQKSRDNVSKKY